MRRYLGRKIANANGLYEGRLKIFRNKPLITVNPPKQVAALLICTVQIMINNTLPSPCYHTVTAKSYPTRKFELGLHRNRVIATT